MICEGVIQALMGGTPYGDSDIDFFTGDPVDIQETFLGAQGSADGALLILNPTTMPDAGGAPVRSMTGDFYYRIWVVPRILRAQNPKVGVPIPFNIWNAYPEDNTLTLITATGDDTLELSITEPVTFREIEFKEVTVTITSATLNNITANYVFDFDLGQGEFDFLAQIVEFMNIRPDVPVKEVWRWLTDLMRAWKGNEQRIALRTYPRKEIEYQLLIEDEAQRRDFYTRWYRSLGNEIVIPMFQYGGYVTETAEIGSSTLYVNMSGVDIRDGESAIVVDPRTEAGEFVTVQTVNEDSVTLLAPLTFQIKAGMIFAPAHRSRLNDKTGLQMRAITGKVSVKADVYEDRDTLPRPEADITLETFDGYPVLHLRPLAEQDVPEMFERGFETLDNQVGKPVDKKSWDHAFVSGNRQWLVDRELTPASMDWWRTFLQAAQGKQNPFLMPTFREDLTMAAPAASGAASIIVAEQDYVTEYFPYETYKRLELEATDGTITRTLVTGAELLDNGTVLLNIREPLTAEVDTYKRISFLNLTRLDSDTVEWSHDHLYSTVEFPVRTIDQ